MSMNLLEQLRLYGDDFDTGAPPVTIDELMGTVDGPVRVQPLAVENRRTVPGWVSAASAAAVVVLFGGVAFLLSPTGSDAPVADTVVATTVVESTPTTLIESVPIAGTWSRVPHDKAVFGAGGHVMNNPGVNSDVMNSVTIGGPGLVAVGRDGASAAVWTSVDGITWSRVPHDESVFGGESALSRTDVSMKRVTVSMKRVTVGGPGLVAVGWEGDTSPDNPDSVAAVWTSVDGVTWSRVPHDEDVFGAAIMEGVTAGGPGLVAVGMDGPFGDGDAAVWTSVDGYTWSRVPHDEMVFGGVDSQMIHDVTVGGPGLVAVGMDGGRTWWLGEGGPNPHAAVWTSVDGVTWSRVPDDEGVLGSGDGPVMLSVVASGSGLVAVGGDWPPLDLKTPVWTSPDGIAWTRVPDDESVRGMMVSVIADGTDFTAVGWTNNVSPSTPLAWSSADGITWTQIPLDGISAAVNDVTVGGPGLVAVGTSRYGAGVWVAEEG